MKTAEDRRWKRICKRLKVGRMIDDRYRVIATDEKGIDAERIETGSRVRITRAMIEKTRAKLIAGEVIEKRKISYTVATETLVVLSLGKTIRETERGYERGDE